MGVNAIGGSLGLLVSVAVLFAPVSYSAPAPQEDSPASYREWPEDVLEVAAEWGVSPADASAALDWENALGIAAARFEQEYPSTYAGIEILSPTDRMAVVAFDGAPPNALEGILQESATSLGLDASTLPPVKVRLAPLSLARIDERMVSIHYAAVKAVPAGTHVSTRYDSSAAAFVVSVAGDPDAMSKVNAAVEARLLANGYPDGAEAVLVESTPLLSATLDARNGGGFLAIGGYVCTGGFNVIHSGGATGVATAGHCPDSTGTHKNRSTDSLSWSLTYMNYHQGEWGDFQWHTTTDTESDDFYYNSTSAARDVTAVGSPVQGQTLCRFGQTTGLQCDTVSELSVCIDAYCRLVQMAHDEAEPGDSGGPWYSGSVAYGYHHGGKTCGTFNQNSCDVWSRQGYMDEAIAAYVKTV